MSQPKLIGESPIVPNICVAQYFMQNVIVTSQRQTGEGNALPIEVVSFNIQKITVTYTKVNSDKSVDSPISFGWDIET